MPDPTLKPASAQESPSWIRERVLAAFAKAGFPEERILPPLAPETDFDALRSVFAAVPPVRILDVGGGTGATALAMALAFPDARIIAVDVNAPLPEMSAAGPADAEASPLGIAAAAARSLRAEGRIRFAAGVFAAHPAAGTGARVVGPDLCAEEGDFDLILIGGSATAESRAADLRLAASALSMRGLIATAGVMGPGGTGARAGVSDFLRYNRDFFYIHPAIASARGSPGLLRHRSAGWFPGFEAPRPMRDETPPDSVRERFADLAAVTLGARPVLEIAVGAPMLGTAFRSRGGVTRTLRLASADWSARFFDPLLDQVLASIDHSPGSAVFSSDLLDFASDEFVTRLFGRLADRKACALLCITPPGEAGVAGIASRPAARVIDVAASQGLSAYQPAGVRTDAAAGQQQDAGSTSRYLSTLLFGRAGGWQDASGRALADVSPASASQHEQQELQRIHAGAAAASRLALQDAALDQAERHRDDLRARLDSAIEAGEQMRRRHDAMLEALRADIVRLTGQNSWLLAAQADADAACRAELEKRQQIERDFAEWMAGAEAQLRETQEREKGLQARFDASRAETEERIRSLQEVAGDLTRQRDAAREDMLAREAEFSAARAAADQKTGAAAERQAELDALLVRAGETERRNEALAAAAAAAEAARAAAIEDTASLRKHAADMSARLSAVTLSESDGRGRLAQLAQERDLLLARQDELSLRLDEAEQRAEALERSLAAYQTEHTSETDGLRTRVSDLGGQLVAADCRDMDALTRLQAVNVHLGVSQLAINTYQEAPADFRADAIAYPETKGAADASERPAGDLIDQITTLQERAAVLARDVARTLEGMSAWRAILQKEFGRRLEASRESQEAGAEKVERDSAERLALVEREAAEISTVSTRNGELITRIERRLQAKRSPAAQDSGGDPSLYTTSQGGKAVPREATIREQLSTQQARLAELLHIIEADIRPASGLGGGGQGGGGGGKSGGARPSPRFMNDLAGAALRLSQASASKRPAAQANGSMVDQSVPRVGGVLHSGRPMWRRTWDLVRTYRETARLVDLQRDIAEDLGPLGLSPRVFDARYYQSHYVIAPHTNPLRHYLLVGEEAGYWPLANFDPAYYARQAGETGDWKGSLLAHFLTEGVYRGLSPCAHLDPLGPLAAASDLGRMAYFFTMEQETRGDPVQTPFAPDEPDIQDGAKPPG